MYMKKRKLFLPLIKCLVTALVIGWVIHTYGWSTIVGTVAKAKLEWLAVGFVINLISFVLGAYQWQIILNNKKLTVPLMQTIKLYFVGMFFNNFILGTVAGDAYKVTSLHVDNRRGKISFAATFLDRLAGLLTLSIFAIIGGSVILITNIRQNNQFLMITGVLFLFGVIVFTVFAFLVSQRLQNVARSLLNRTPDFPGKELLSNVLEALFINRRGKEDKKMLLGVAFLSFIIQALRVCVHIFCAQAFGIFSAATTHFFFVIVPIIALLMIVPMPFGIREAIQGALFAYAGFPEEEALMVAFIATVLGIGASFVGGLFFLFDKKKIPAAEKTPSSMIEKSLPDQ